MTQPQIKNIFFICLAILLFFLDIFLFSILQQHLLLILHCFVITLLANNYATSFVVAPIFMLSLLSYLDTNIFGFCLIYILPTILLAKYLDEHLRVKVIIPYILLVASILMKIKAFSFMHIAQLSWCSLAEFTTYNIICLTIFLIFHHKFSKTVEN